MKILTLTETVAIIELESGDAFDKEALFISLNACLEKKGFEKWKSIDAECYTYNNSGIIIAKPVEVYIPKCLLELSR